MLSELAQLFAISLLISLTTFGGGSQALFYQFGVIQTHWITRADLSAALAFGYATPGPAVFSMATFIGYKLDNLTGAVVGTIGIFIVPFLLSLVAAKYLMPLLTSRRAEFFVKGIGLAAAGVVAATAFSVLGYHTASYWQFLIMGAAVVVSLSRKINPLFILMTGGIIGLFI